MARMTPHFPANTSAKTIRSVAFGLSRVLVLTLPLTLALVLISTACKNLPGPKQEASVFCDSLQTQFEAADVSIGAAVWNNTVRNSGSGRVALDSLQRIRSLWFERLTNSSVLADIDEYLQTATDTTLLRRLTITRKRVLTALIENDPTGSHISDSLRPVALKSHETSATDIGEFTNDSIPLLYRRRELYHQLNGANISFSSEIVRLARLRNQRCRALGYSSLLDLNLQLSGLTRDQLDKTLETIDSATIGRYRHLLKKISRTLSHRNLEEADVSYYEQIALAKFRRSFTRKEALEFAIDVITGLGFNIRYASLFIDSVSAPPGAPWLIAPHPPEDIRLSYRTTKTHATAREIKELLNRLGVSIYLLANPKTTYLMRQPEDPLVARCIGQLFTDLLERRELQNKYNRIKSASYEAFTTASADVRLIQLRRLLVMIRFEMELFDDPNRDMAAVYNRVVGKSLLVKPDKQYQLWTNDRSLALSPATQFCRLYASFLSAQIYSSALREFGSLADNPQFGDYLQKTYFHKLPSTSWADALLLGAGEQLNLKYFLDQFATNSPIE